MPKMIKPDMKQNTFNFLLKNTKYINKWTN